MKIIEPVITEYLECLTPERHPVQQEMEKYAGEHNFPIIGPLVGRFLQQLVVLTGARSIFEMGSGYGYSALWMALTLPDDGKIQCTEFDADNIARGKDFLKRAGVDGKVSWLQGDALDHIKKARGPFDIILNDVDKHQYPNSLEIAWPKLRRGGAMITDNSLWSGRVVTEDPPTKSTSGVLRINKNAYALDDGVASIIPLRDGLLLIVKK
jgi:caffeoyl-CoA O-methyltransferase